MARLTIAPADIGGDRLLLTFPYDPKLTEFIKTIPGREWNRAHKCWLVPSAPETLIYIRDRKPAGVTLTIHPKIVSAFHAQSERLMSASVIRERGDAQIEHKFVTEPYAHQRAGLAFLAELGSGGLLWEMGLGKTKTAIDYAEWLCGPVGFTDQRVLVICPNTVKRNWSREIEMHAGHSDYRVLGETIDKRIFELGRRRYSIVNCEALSIPKFAKAAAAIEWDLVIVDESTRFKNPKANRTKALLALGKRARRRIILTGTPITGSPEDAWAQFEFVQPGVFGSWYGFVDRFLARDYFGNVTGIKDGEADELAQRIGRRSYRVLKSQVLDLPPKVYTDRVVEMTPIQRKAYEQMRDELRVELESLPKITAFNVLTVLLRLTQITAGVVGSKGAETWIPENAKVAELDNLLNDELRGEQVVIFGLYQRELEELAMRYSRHIDWPAPAGSTTPLPIIYGPTPERVRHELIEQFQAGKRRLLFAQIRTGGIGINLTAARTAIYYSRSWSLEEYLQSQDRLHRIGQTGTVSIVHLVARGTIDEEIATALADKQNMADRLTGDAALRLARTALGGKS